MGLVLAVVVHTADVQDRDGARLALMRLVCRFPRLKRIWADRAYAGKWCYGPGMLVVGPWSWCGGQRTKTLSRSFPAAGSSSARSHGSGGTGD